MRDDDHHGGLAHDLRKMIPTLSRRQMLRLMAGASLVPILGCGGEGDVEAADGGTAGQDGSSSSTCATIPEETQGPYPGDGSNGANALTLSGIVRSDIRTSLGNLSGTAAGVPLTVKLKLVDTAAGCAALAGYAIYVWHCDREGNYSMYTLTTQNYLRGVQETGSDGQVTFQTTFPGCYPGRWPHIHFEVYPTLARATAAGNEIKTSQLALPADACNAVYATAGYSQSVTNLGRITLASDNVFSDGASRQIATVTGSVSEGYTAALDVGIAA